MIKAESLTRRYGRVTAVRQVSFHIEGNGVVGLLGHNGAGKSTLMKMLSGYLEPTAGRLQVSGYDYADGCRPTQRTLGYLPEDLPLYPDMLVADYLDYVAICKGIVRAQRSAALREALAATSLEARALERINRLSRGLRQRVAVAQAILGKPRLLILDEPGNGLDPLQTQQMRELISYLARRATVILSTHILQEVEALCERVLIMDSGHLVLDARLEDLRRSHSLLLRVHTPSDSLRDALGQLPAVVAVQGRPGEGEYHLSLGEDSTVDAASTASANSVHVRAAGLVSLQCQQRDLETVFRDAIGKQVDGGARQR
ncbi:MAG: ABC transporter ATP-binding protein [Parahaliea sp.]